MEEQEILLLINEGFGLEKHLPEEFKKAIKTKLIQLSKEGKEPERWQAIMKGFELSERKRTKERKQDLEKTKSKSRGKSQGRSR